VALISSRKAINFSRVSSRRPSRVIGTSSSVGWPITGQLTGTLAASDDFAIHGNQSRSAYVLVGVLSTFPLRGGGRLGEGGLFGSLLDIFDRGDADAYRVPRRACVIIGSRGRTSRFARGRS
jgi:hypothetical protein